MQIFGDFTFSCQLSYFLFRILERKDCTLLDAQDLSRLPVNHTLDHSRTDVMVWYFEDGWIQLFAGLLTANSPILLSSCLLHTHIFSNNYFPRSKVSLNYWLLSLSAIRSLKADFFSQLSPSRCTSTGENHPRNSIHRTSPDICLGLSLPVFSASFNYKALFNYWMKEAGKPMQLEHA